MDSPAIGRLEPSGKNGAENASLSRDAGDADAASFAEPGEVDASAHGPGLGIVEIPGAMRGMSAPESLRDQNLHWLAQEFATFIAEKLLDLRIDQDDSSPLVNDEHCVGSSFEEALEFDRQHFVLTAEVRIEFMRVRTSGQERVLLCRSRVSIGSIKSKKDREY
jgi:hypothetical protein